MSDQMVRLSVEVERINDKVREAFIGLSTEQLNWKPNPKSWSIAQCLEHLIVTNGLYFENIQKVADGNHSNSFYSKVPLATGIVAWGMKKVLSPDFRPKIKTSKYLSRRRAKFPLIFLKILMKTKSVLFS